MNLVNTGSAIINLDRCNSIYLKGKNVIYQVGTKDLEIEYRSKQEALEQYNIIIGIIKDYS